VPRAEPDSPALDRAAAHDSRGGRPIIVAGGGVIYADANSALRQLVEMTGIPVGETQAGKGSLPHDHPSNLGAVGATRTLAAKPPGARGRCRDRDRHPLDRFHDRFATRSSAARTCTSSTSMCSASMPTRTAASPWSAMPASVSLRWARGCAATPLTPRTATWPPRLNRTGIARSTACINLGHGPLPAQSEVIGAVNDAAAPRDVVVCAAGSMPGDLHKLWRTRDPKQYHVEYGYSCMGYEIAGALGVKMAAPDREVFSMVGDGSYLMMSSEIVTAVQEGIKLIIVLVDNHGFNSIGGLSRSLGTDGFGTQYRFSQRTDRSGSTATRRRAKVLPIDLAANAAAWAPRPCGSTSIDELRGALDHGSRATRTSVICIEVDRYEGVPNYESWWDVPVAEVATVESVNAARREYEKGAHERTALPVGGRRKWPRAIRCHPNGRLRGWSESNGLAGVSLRL